MWSSSEGILGYKEQHLVKTSGTKFLRPNASTRRRDTGRSERAPWTPPPLLAFRRHFPPDSAPSSGAQRRPTAPWRTRAAVCVHNCQFAFPGAPVFRRLKGKLNSFLMYNLLSKQSYHG